MDQNEVLKDNSAVRDEKNRIRKAQRQSKLLDVKKLMKEPFTLTVILLITLFLLLFVVYPLLNLFVGAFSKSVKVGTVDGFAIREDQFSFENFTYIFSKIYYGDAIKNSMIIGLIVAFGATLFGFFFAYVEVYVKFKSKLISGLFRIVSLLPTISPPFLIAIAIILLFGNNGIITNIILGMPTNNGLFGIPGIVIVEIITFFPTAYLLLRALLKNIDPSLEEAARDMGASRWKVFWTVTFPLLIPGFGNAFLVSFIESLADFANPFIIGGSVETMSTAIYNSYMGGGSSAQGPYRASAMAVILLCISMFFYVIQKYGLEKKTYSTLTGKATRQRIMIEEKSVTMPLGIICGGISIFVIGLYFLVFLCTFWRNLDIKNLVWTTANWTEIGSKMFLSSSNSLWNTVWTSLVASIITAAISMLIAFLVVKKRFIGKGAMEFIAMLAMAVPGTVLGVGFCRGFVQGVFGSGFLRFIYGNMLIIIIIFIVRSLPIGIRSGVTALKQIDKSIEESAMDMGAGSGKVFTSVTVPLIKDSLFSSLVTSFVRSMTALSAIIVISVPGTTLITYEMNELSNKGAYEQAAVYATVLILIAGLAVGLMNLVIRFFGTSRVRKEKKPKLEGENK